MHKGMSLQALASEVARQQGAKADFVADTRHVRLQPSTARNNGFTLQLGDDKRFPLSQHALRQLEARTKVPAKFADYVAGLDRDLLADTVNRLFDLSPKRQLVRTMDGGCRAVLSDRYNRALDNYDLLNAVLPALKGDGIEIVSVNVSWSKLYVKAVKSGHRVEVKAPGAQWGVGHDTIHVLRPGIVVENSEVGMGRLAVRPAVHTEHCSNLAISRESTFARVHLGRILGGDAPAELYEHLSNGTKRLTDAALWSQVRDLVRESVQGGTVFDSIVDRVRASMDSKTIERPAEAIQALGNRYTLTEEEGGGILKHLASGGDLTQYGVQAAVTRFASDVEDYDRSTELEKVGGQIIELKPTEWEEIAKAA